MAGQLLPQALWTALDANGAPISGATLTFYLTGTTTPATVYTDSALSVPAGLSARTSDSAGRFNQLYFDEAVIYKVVLKDAAGTAIDTIDPLNFALPVDDIGAPGVNYLQDLSGVLSGTSVSTTAFSAAISTISADPGVIELPPETLTMSAAGLVLKDKVPLRGQGKDLTVLDFSGLGAFSTLITATGTGPGTWNAISTAITRGQTTLSNVGGTLTAYAAKGHIMIRSTEFGPVQINDVEKFTWAATTSISLGALTFANGNWYICTTAGTTGATAPTSTSNPVTDGSATLYYIDYANSQNQRRWAASTAYAKGDIRVLSDGRILICCTNGTSGSSSPSFVSANTPTNVTDGTVVWRYAGYYNSTKGELKPYAVDRVSGTTIYLSEPIEDDYPQSYTGVTFTVECAPVTLAEISLEDLTIKGRGIPAAGSLSAVGTGTSLYYISSELCDIGILAKFCILRLKNVRFTGIEQFQVHAGCTVVEDENCEYIFSPTHIDSQQYGVYLQGASSQRSKNPLDINSRHLTDGDGSASTATDAYRGIPGPIIVTGSKSIACWQSVVGNHRASRYLACSGFEWSVLTAGFKSRCANFLLDGGFIRGPKYSSINDYIAQDGLVTCYYQAGKGTIRGVRTDGGAYGLRVSNSDGTIGDLDIQMSMDAPFYYGARLGVADGDQMENIRIDLTVKDVTTYDNILIDGPLANSTIKLRYDGGRKGVTSTNRKPKLTNCTFDVSGQDCTEEAIDLYNMVGGHILGGVRGSTTSNVINRVKDAIAVTIDRATSIAPASFTGEFWKIQATSASLTSYLEMADQVCYSPSGTGGTCLTVEANVSNSRFGRMNSPHTIKISAGVNSTNTYADAPNNLQDGAYGFVAQDMTPGRTVTHTSGSAHAWTISQSVFPVGARITIANIGAGTVTLTRGSGIALRIAGSSTDKNVAFAQYGVATLIHVSTDSWLVQGTGLS